MRQTQSSWMPNRFEEKKTNTQSNECFVTWAKITLTLKFFVTPLPCSNIIQFQTFSVFITISDECLAKWSIWGTLNANQIIDLKLTRHIWIDGFWYFASAAHSLLIRPFRWYSAIFAYISIQRLNYVINSCVYDLYAFNTASVKWLFCVLINTNRLVVHNLFYHLENHEEHLDTEKGFSCLSYPKYAKSY